MIQKSIYKRITEYFACVALTTFACALIAQSSSDLSEFFDQSELPEGFSILSQSEAEEYQKERLEEFKRELQISELSDTHQDLLAHALSTTFKGIPISTFQQVKASEGLHGEPWESTETLVVEDTGRVQDMKFKSRSLSVTGLDTPFSYREGVPVQPESGRVLDETDSEISFRFDVDLDYIFSDLRGSPLQFPEGLIQEERIDFVMDITINKEDRYLKRSSLHLAKPLRKMFVFSLKTLEITLDYEFVKECGCSVIHTASYHTDGSIILGGRMFSKRTVTYSDVYCEQPMRYVLPPEDSFVGLLVRF
ncbi:MAG: hypothetical protein F4Z01_06380 [Gammaproteobacteria bacterium]|nr:hypothetical protein [Gammaproteobacteria bacterium]MYF37594.1 hypothetical protein [Gammaproteobacteria bacterium]